MNSIKKNSKKSEKEKQLWLNQLGSNIKELRETVGMTQADVAYSIGMDAQNISRIERGLVSPAAYAVYQIITALGSNLEKPTLHFFRRFIIR